jgi:hypothetical protein
MGRPDVISIAEVDEFIMNELREVYISLRDAEIRAGS